MKARTKKMTAISLGLIMGASTFGTVLHAETITKTLKATYNDIKVTFNGDYKQPVNEPFLINGSVYVALRDAGEMTGNKVDWDSANKTVKITDTTANNSVSSTELANKNLEISSLKTQVKQLEEKLAKYEKQEAPATDSNLSSSAIKKTLEEIEDEYEDKNGISWEFDLSESKGALELDITVARNSSSKFNSLSSTKLETFLKDICEDIADNHKAVEIKGTIYDEKSDEDVMAFAYSTKGKFSIDSSLISNRSLERFADELERDSDYSNLPKINVDGLKTESFSVKGIDLEYNSKKELITFFVGVDTTKITEWNKLINDGANNDRSDIYSTSQISNLAYFLEDICDDIAYEFDVDVEGMIYNTNSISTSAAINKGELMVRYQLNSRSDDYSMVLVPLSR
ncbi:MAG: stalk domain-containing protein [Cellulosilyticaceae bacterium]